jgi:hypothetical protein
MHPFARIGWALALASLGCTAAQPLWWADTRPTLAVTSILLETDRADRLASDTLLLYEIPDIPMRRKLRPCCAFGSDLGASIAGLVPIPGYRVPNILGREHVGPHSYDSGMVSVAVDGRVDPAFDREHNGLVYTCRGGFIDTAHVRDYADWAIYLTAQIARRASSGGSFELSDEAGRRRVHVEPLPTEAIDRFGLSTVVANLGQWLAFQLSIWHEIATWYDYASVPGFSERASAFSPEDLYSNALGIRLVMAVVYTLDGRSEFTFNRAIDHWFDQSLVLLGAVPRELGQEVARALDGLWWDSSRRLPDPMLVKRRNLEIASPIHPWQAPDSALPAELRARLAEACEGDQREIALENPGSGRGYRFGDYVRLEIETDDRLAKHEPFATRGRSLTQADFPAVVEVIREQVRAEFGPRADRRD